MPPPTQPPLAPWRATPLPGTPAPLAEAGPHSAAMAQVQAWLKEPQHLDEAALRALTEDSAAAAEDALAQSRPAAELQALAELLLLVQRVHHMRADCRAALPLANAAVALARQCTGPGGASGLLRRALSWCGITHSDRGLHAEALTHLAEALRVAGALGDTDAEAAVWSSLGVAMRRISRCEEASACFERALALAPSTGPYKGVVAQALTNLADCARYLGDLDRGLAAARGAIAVAPQADDPLTAFAHTCAESSCVRLLLMKGDLATAALHLKTLRAWASAYASPRADMVAGFTEGLFLVQAGKTASGLAHVRAALDLARRQLPSELYDLLETSIVAYRLAGQPEVALVHLHELQTLHQQASTHLVQGLQQDHLRQLSRAEQAGPPAATRHDRLLATQRAGLREALGEREQLQQRVQVLEQQCVMAEMHDDVTGRHCYRVGRLASLLGREIGLEEDVCFLIDLAARLHDIGKLAIPDSILLKPGRLTDEERLVMQSHAAAGADILARSGVPELHVAETIARHHHERWDGTGYPDRLAGNAIPIAARVTALADVFDALTHARPYKAAWTVEEALAEIRRMRGLHFDPAITDAFLLLVPRLQREAGDLDGLLGASAASAPLVQATDDVARALAERPLQACETRPLALS